MRRKLVHDLADRIQRTLARSSLAVRVAVLLRNQARCVIKYYLAESPNVKETGEAWVLGLVAPDARRIVDVGANIGDWLACALACSNAQVAVIACEPSSSAHALLSKRYDRDARVSVSDAALGDVVGTMAFLEEPNAGRGSTLVPGLGRIEGSERIVSVTTLAALFEHAGWDEADMVKIDAEGFDARVIRGGESLIREQRIGIVQFEYNRAWQIAEETLRGTYRRFEEAGYRVFLLKRDGLYDLDYARYEEYFEYSNFIAIAPAWMPRFVPYLRGRI